MKTKKTVFHSVLSLCLAFCLTFTAIMGYQSIQLRSAGAAAPKENLFADITTATTVDTSRLYNYSCNLPNNVRLQTADLDNDGNTDSFVCNLAFGNTGQIKNQTREMLKSLVNTFLTNQSDSHYSEQLAVLLKNVPYYLLTPAQIDTLIAQGNTISLVGENVTDGNPVYLAYTDTTNVGGTTVSGNGHYQYPCNASVYSGSQVFYDGKTKDTLLWGGGRCQCGVLSNSSNSSNKVGLALYFNLKGILYSANENAPFVSPTGVAAWQNLILPKISPKTATDSVYSGPQSGEAGVSAYTGGAVTLNCAQLDNQFIHRAARGLTYTFDVTDVCTNAETGHEKYVSAAIWDGEGNPVYYERLADVETTPQIGLGYSKDGSSTVYYHGYHSTDMTVQMTIPKDLYADHTYTLAVFEEDYDPEANVSTCSIPVFANFTVGSIESLYAVNMDPDTGLATETHANHVYEDTDESVLSLAGSINDTTLESDSKVYRDNQLITDKSNFLVLENVVDEDTGEIMQKQKVPAENYHMMDYDQYCYYASYAWAMDEERKATELARTFTIDGLQLNYEGCASAARKKQWVQALTDYYEQQGQLDDIVHEFIPSKETLNTVDANAREVGMNMLDKINIPELPAGETSGTHDVIFFNYEYDGDDNFVGYYRYVKTLNIVTDGKGAEDPSNNHIVNSEGWLEWTDPQTNITWNYIMSNNGRIEYLYSTTEDALEKLTQHGDVANNIDTELVLSDNDILVVPSEINGIVVEGIGSGFKDRTFVPFNVNEQKDAYDSILFPSSLKYIKDYAFYQTSGGYNEKTSGFGSTSEVPTMKLSLPSGIETIGMYAFYGAGDIKTIEYDMHTADIGYKAFSNCSGLDMVVLSSSGSSIVGQEAFSNNAAMTNIILHGNMELMARAFYKNPSVTTLNIDDLTGTAHFEAFRGLTSLESLYVPATLTIEAAEKDKEHGYVFRGCTSLKYLEFEPEVLKATTFYDCAAITNIILCSGVDEVEADWGGYAEEELIQIDTNIDRNIVVKNPDTKFNFIRTKDDNYISGFGYYNGPTIHHNNGGNLYIVSPQYSNVQSSTWVSGPSGYFEAYSAIPQISSAYQGENEDQKKFFTVDDKVTISFTMKADANDPVFAITYKNPRVVEGIKVTQAQTVHANDKITRNHFTVQPVYSDKAYAQESYDNFYIFRTADYDKLVADKVLTKKILADSELFEDAVSTYLTEHPDEGMEVNTLKTNPIEPENTLGVYYEKLTFVQFLLNEDEEEERFNETIAVPVVKMTNQEAYDKALSDAEVADITELADKIAALKEQTLADAQTIADKQAMIDAYQNSLDDIYNLLTGEELTGVEAAMITASITSFQTKMAKTETDLTIAENSLAQANELATAYKAALTDIENALNGVISNNTASEIDSTQSELNEKQLVYNAMSDEEKASSAGAILAGEIDALQEKLEHLTSLKEKVDTITGNGAIGVSTGSSIKQMQDQITNLDKQAQDLEQTVNNQSQTIHTLSEQAISLKQTVDEQKDTITDMDGQIQDLTKQNEESAKRVASLEGSVSSLSAINQTMQTELDDLGDKLSVAKDEIERGEATVQSLEQTVLEANATIATLRQENATQQSTIQEMTTTISEMDAANREQAQTIADLTSSLNDLKASNSSLNTQIEALNATIETLTQENGSLSLQVAALQNQLAQTEEANNEMIAQIASLEQQLREATATGDGYKITAALAEQLFAAVPNANGNVSVAINALIAENTQSRIVVAKAQEVYGSRATGEDLAKLISTSSGAAVSGGTIVVEKVVEKPVEKIVYVGGGSTSSSDSASASQTAAITAENTKLTTENKTLQTQVTALQAENQTLNTGIDELSTLLSGVQVASIRTVKTNAVSASDKLSKIKTAVNSLITNNRTLSSKNTKLTDKNTKLTDKNTKLAESNKKLTERTNTYKASITSLKDKNTALQAENGSLKSSNTSLSAQVSALKSVNAGANQTTQKQPVTEPEPETKPDESNVLHYPQEEETTTETENETEEVLDEFSEEYIEIIPQAGQIAADPKEEAERMIAESISNTESLQEINGTSAGGIQDMNSEEGGLEGDNSKAVTTASKIPLYPIFLVVFVVAGVVIYLFLGKRKKNKE